MRLEVEVRSSSFSLGGIDGTAGGQARATEVAGFAQQPIISLVLARMNEPSSTSALVSNIATMLMMPELLAWDKPSREASSDNSMTIKAHTPSCGGTSHVERCLILDRNITITTAFFSPASGLSNLCAYATSSHGRPNAPPSPAADLSSLQRPSAESSISRSHTTS